MLLYAWDCVPRGGVDEVGIDTSPNLPTLLGKVLNEGAHRLWRRGLDQGYVEVTEETRTPRGKLRLEIMSKQQTLLRGQAVCDWDERTVNVLHNQILRTTLRSLAHCEDVAQEQRRELIYSWRQMKEVSLIRLKADLFRRVQFSRHISHYGFLMRICELVFHMLLPDQQCRGSKFRNVLKDDLYMPGLFEKFLRNFYRIELTGYKAQSESMKWIAVAPQISHLEYLPRMITDITLRSQESTIVADAKYYSDFLAGGQRAPKAHSANLYQLLTYLNHIYIREPEKLVSGLLVYPAADRTGRLEYRLLDIPVTVATVDLGAEWPNIHRELLGLIPI